MYLSDKDLLKKWAGLNIDCDNSECEIDCKSNIQPSSIDLCLSNVFWEPQKLKTIDLRKSALLELSPRRYWKKKVLRKNEHITLKPGKLLLGRVAAKLTIPNDCAGKIEGRSSFARMGIGVHCTGDFINPGYRGHMPLELINFSPNPIKIFPYLPICQLMLIKLSSEPDQVYGDKELQSKYMDDDGGPSFWWRDKKIKSLQQVFMNKSVELYVQEHVLKKVGVQEPEIIERFEKFVYRKPEKNLENADLLLDEFSKSEKRLRKKDKIINGLSTMFFPICLTTTLTLIFITPNSLLQYFIWGSTIFSLYPFICAYRETPKQYFGKQELLKIDTPH